MRKLILILAVGCSLLQTARSQAPQHQHEQSQVINGAEHPELIPNSTAFRHWLLMASVTSNPSDLDLARQRAELSKLGFIESENLKLLLVLADFRGRYEALIQRHNDLARAGKHPDLSLLLQQLDDLVESTKTAIKTTLSPHNSTEIENLVNAHKREILVQASTSTR